MENENEILNGSNQPELAQTTQGQPIPSMVLNLDQALSILIQGCEMGREKGIFNWSDLNLLGQSIAFVTNSLKQSQILEDTNK